jgi:endonuclease/exonuclease/phosphatase (EEP) superfamily protein YafD
MDFKATRIAGLGDALLVVGLLCTLLSLFGSLHWALDLFTHFRWQYLASCLVAVPWYAWRRSRRMLVWASVSLGVNLALLFGWIGGAQYDSDSTAEPFLKVVSVNVRTENEEVGKVLDFVRTADADAVLFMEVDDFWEEGLQPLKAIYPNSRFESRVDNFGIALYTKLEVEKLEIRNPGYAVPIVVATLKKDGRSFRFVGVHPVPPAGKSNSQYRNEDINAYAALARESEGPMLLVGDLNSSPWSEGMRILTSGSDLRLGGALNAAMPTWMVGTLVSIPIDHALAQKPLTILRRTIGPEVGSDHRPIVIEVGWVR